MGVSPGVAVVLYETYRGSRRVAACSPAARDRGLAIGMPLSEATALLGGRGGSSPRSRNGRRWRLAAHDPRADRAALERLATWCHRFSPLVGLEDAAEPDSLLLDVTGVARFFGGEEALAHRIFEPFARRGIPIRVGLADTVGAAWAAAHFESPERCLRRTLGSSSLFRPNDGGGAGRTGLSPSTPQEHPDCRHLRIIPPGETETVLDAMPLEALRLPAGVLDLLGQLGVRRIGELASLPRADFNARFGPELLRRWDQATGRLDEPIVPLPLPPRFEAEQSFEFPTANRLALETVLRQLVERVAQMAVLAGRGAWRIEGCFGCQAARSVRFDVGLFRPTASAEHLFGLLQMRLERLALPGKVETVRVEIVETAVSQGRQAELFDTGAIQEQRPADLVDRLASRLGREAILGVSLLAEAQPELAYRYTPLVGAASKRRSKTVPADNLPPRPLCLLPRPVELEAAEIVPDGPPLHFLLPDGRQQVARAWGPERIETGWWRGRPTRRDYYRVETRTGSRFWLFRSKGRWFLHGVFW